MHICHTAAQYESQILEAVGLICMDCILACHCTAYVPWLGSKVDTTWRPDVQSLPETHMPSKQLRQASASTPRHALPSSSGSVDCRRFAIATDRRCRANLRTLRSSDQHQLVLRHCVKQQITQAHSFAKHKHKHSSAYQLPIHQDMSIGSTSARRSSCKRRPSCTRSEKCGCSCRDVNIYGMLGIDKMLSDLFAMRSST